MNETEKKIEEIKKRRKKELCAICGKKLLIEYRPKYLHLSSLEVPYTILNCPDHEDECTNYQRIMQEMEKPI